MVVVLHSLLLLCGVAGPDSGLGPKPPDFLVLVIKLGIHRRMIKPADKQTPALDSD